MIKLNSNILNQFAQKGLSINEGIAIDARLVQSASHPISNDDIKKQREKRNTPEGQVDKIGNPIKFQRDLESDWVVQNDSPHYGLKEHASVAINHGFVLVNTVTQALHHDSPWLPYCTAVTCYIKNSIEKMYAHKKYW